MSVYGKVLLVVDGEADGSITAKLDLHNGPDGRLHVGLAEQREMFPPKHEGMGNLFILLGDAVIPLGDTFQVRKNARLFVAQSTCCKE